MIAREDGHDGDEAGEPTAADVDAARDRCHFGTVGASGVAFAEDVAGRGGCETDVRVGSYHWKSLRSALDFVPRRLAWPCHDDLSR